MKPAVWQRAAAALPRTVSATAISVRHTAAAPIDALPSAPAHRAPATDFELAFREHRQPLIRFLRRRVGNEDDAVEIAQEAFVRLLRYTGQAEPHALKSLLYRIAINLVAMRARELRQRHRLVDGQADAYAVPSNEPLQEQRLVDQESLALLMEAIRELPERCRLAFVLSRFHDMSYPQIAEHCGISVKMVEKHITRALAACREKLGGDLP